MIILHYSQVFIEIKKKWEKNKIVPHSYCQMMRWKIVHNKNKKCLPSNKKY